MIKKRFNDVLSVIAIVISLLSVASSAYVYVTFTDDLRYTDTGEVIRN